MTIVSGPAFEDWVEMPYQCALADWLTVGLSFIVWRTLFRNSFTFWGEGLINSFPLYLRMFIPRKSNPSLMCVIRVFSGERVSPLSARKFSNKGRTFSDSVSWLIPVITKSSA